MSLFSMPRVYVIPPEEDESPPFCCFDAAHPIPYTPTQADLDAAGSALDIIYHGIPDSSETPTFYRKDIHSTGIVMPRRRAVGDPHSGDITIRGNSPGDDSEIIEVIKVRRNGDSQPVVAEPVSKQPKGFKARASRAFNSLRFGRSTSQKKKDEIQDSEETESIRAPSPSPMSRRPSMILTNLFSRSPSLRTSSSMDSFADSSPSSPTTPLPTPPDTISSSSPLSIQIHSPPSADMHSFVPCATDLEDDDDEDEVYSPDNDDPEATPRAQRPMSPTSQSTKSTRRRFSVMSLFSLASSQPVVATSPSTPALPVMSRDSMGPSSDSSSSSSSSMPSTGPPTPVDEPFPPPPPGRTSSSSSLLKRVTSFSKRKEGSRSSQSLDLAPEPELVVDIPQTVDEADASFGEMRLDSLHFSELSFDADKFEIRP
ncbi:hypothetical protein VNI00_008320 [Paramarasmius palmivorus]|uniref:Uncharacterized protein n=1 Tax=Paramarasmius palmivorus TaxID=297713 RepID=A0AAW0CYK6_9AGAR